MATIAPTLPTQGEDNSTADPKILNAFQAILALVNGGIDSANLKDAGVTLPDLGSAVQAMLLKPGMLVPTFAPTADFGFLFCDGTYYQQSTYPALFARIGHDGTDPGDGTFRIPDLRGRFPLGATGTSGGTHNLGTTGGEEKHTLLATELPGALGEFITSAGAGSSFSAAAGGDLGFHGASTTGGVPMNNMPPFRAVQFQVKY